MSTGGRIAAGVVSFALWGGGMSSAAAQTPTQLSPPASAPTPPLAKRVAKTAPAKPPRHNVGQARADTSAAGIGQPRHGFWRVPARPLRHRVFDRDPAGERAERRQSDDAARRTLRQRPGSRARRQESGGMVRAGGRAG